MTDYPSTLPAPQIAEYGVGNQFGLSAVRFETGQTRQRRGAKRDKLYFVMSFVFTTPQLWEWQSWANQYGYDWHLMDLESHWSGLALTAESTIPHRVRYTSDITITALGAGYVKATVQAEMDTDTIPQNVVVVSGNWYLAGEPATPSNSNNILAGTPSSPSANAIIAGSPSLPAA